MTSELRALPAPPPPVTFTGTRGVVPPGVSGQCEVGAAGLESRLTKISSVPSKGSEPPAGVSREDTGGCAPRRADVPQDLGGCAPGPGRMCPQDLVGCAPKTGGCAPRTWSDVPPRRAAVAPRPGQMCPKTGDVAPGPGRMCPRTGVLPAYCSRFTPGKISRGPSVSSSRSVVSLVF